MIKPFYTFDELISFSGDCINNFSKNRLLYQEKDGKCPQDKITNGNQVIFCHDMMGGYLDDAEISNNSNIYAFRFYHWHLIDTFIYFSHHFVTIPPSEWIRLCHKHGVKCLGTLIFEGNENENFQKFFNYENIELAAEKLNEVKNHFKFDGWLINIECKIKNFEREEIVKNIECFLKILKCLDNEVVWYDSITKHGDLLWQNCLNKVNNNFYDIVGNIFTNYTWNSKSLCSSSTICGPINHSRVFVGIDCFGRGCPGGGGFNCKEALEMLEKFYTNCANDTDNAIMKDKIEKFSIALFAPGWCYESICDKEKPSKLDENIWLFYELMNKYLHVFKPPQTTLYRSLPEQNLYTTPFNTDFSLGQGYSSFQSGQLIKEQDHYNYLGEQQFFPSGLQLDSDQAKLMILPDRTISFSNRSCARINLLSDTYHKRFPRSNSKSSNIELFRLNGFLDKMYRQKCVVCFVIGIKNIFEDIPQGISLQLIITTSDDSDDIPHTLVLPLKENKSKISGDRNIVWFKYDWLLNDELNLKNNQNLMIKILKLEISNVDFLNKSALYLGHLSISVDE